MKYKKEEQRALLKRSKELLEEPNATGNKAKDQIDDLIKTIVYHEWRYYVLNEPVVSDYEYDHLYKKLEALEQVNPLMLRPDSPTQRVSNDLTEDFPSVAHLIPMLSLDNSYNIEDLQDFDKRVKGLVDLPEDAEIEYCVEPKFDGGSIALVYENNALIRAATRGNGTMGEEMTNNARAMRSIPIQADFKKYGIQKVELRGEVIIRMDTFEKVNKKREAAGQSILANARNAATGAMRVKDPKEVERRGLEAFVYQLGFAIDDEGDDKLSDFKTHDEGIKMLGDLGFKIPKSGYERKVCKNIQEAHQFCVEWEARRDQYNYEIDGMVVKVNEVALQNKCGYTSHHPRWAIAYKFKAKQATTKLLNVEYQIGKIGSVTPVAKLEPVQLAGVTISSVSLHNEDFIKTKDIRLGDTVLVERSGDVIPYIVKTIDDIRDGSEKVIDFPKNCPSCSTQLVRTEGEAAWRCTNPTCEAQILQKMIFHVSKDAMDIDGFGKSYVERFYEMGWLKSIADIYRLDYDKIAQLEGFGTKSAANLKKAIEKAKQNPIRRLLHSLSIHHLGKKVSRLLAGEIKEVLDLTKWEEENFTNIKDVGPKVAENVMTFFREEQNVALIKELESLGVNVKQTKADEKEEVITDGVLSGKTILFTGSLQEVTRKEAQELAKKAGAKVASGVSSNLNILVVGEKAGSKLKKAQALGTVEIITEEAFLKIVS